MARAHLRHTIRDAAGNVVQNALCNIYQPGTSTAVTGMWDAKTGGTALNSPLASNAQGEIEAWLDAAQSVEIEVTDNNDGAYYPSQPTQKLSWDPFRESTEVGKAPEDQGGASTLPALTDVADTATPTAGHVLRGTGTAWTNSAIQDGDIPAAIARDAEVAAAYQALSDIVFKRKTADESVVSSTVLQNDDHLFFAMAANEVWVFDAFIKAEGPAGADINLSFGSPAGSVLSWAVLPDTTPTNTFEWSAVRGNGATRDYGLEGGVDAAIHVKGIVRNGATAGNLQFQWAQFTASATAVVVRTDSFLDARKVS